MHHFPQCSDNRFIILPAYYRRALSYFPIPSHQSAVGLRRRQQFEHRRRRRHRRSANKINTAINVTYVKFKKLIPSGLLAAERSGVAKATNGVAGVEWGGRWCLSGRVLRRFSCGWLPSSMRYDCRSFVQSARHARRSG